MTLARDRRRSRFEKDQLIERSNAVLARACAEGTKLRRRASLSKQQLQVLSDLEAGLSVVKLAKSYATSRHTIMRIRENGRAEQ